MGEAIETSDNLPSLPVLVSQYRLIAALMTMDQDHPTMRYPFISEEYRHAVRLVMAYFQEAYPPGSEIHEEAKAIIRLMDEVR